MAKKNTLLVVVLLVLVAVYAIFFTDWFKPHVIKMFYTTRPIEHFRARQDIPYIVFGLEQHYRLTEVKVVSLEEFQRNPAAPPLWHLVSKSRSVPVRMFAYGEHIHGMEPAVQGEQPQPLEPNRIYRLFVSAGGTKGQIDFKLK